MNPLPNTDVPNHEFFNWIFHPYYFNLFLMVRKFNVVEGFTPTMTNLYFEKIRKCDIRSQYQKYIYSDKIIILFDRSKAK